MSKQKKLKLNFKNFYTTNSTTVFFIYFFRIVILIFVFLLPIVISLIYNYDKGINSLVKYVYFSASGNFKAFIDKMSFIKSSTDYDNFNILFPIYQWFFWSIYLFFFIFLPFFISKSKTGKGFLSFWMLIQTALIFLFVYLVWYYIPKFPHNPIPEDITQVNDKDVSWLNLINDFKFDNFWMITLQVIGSIYFVYFIFEAIESDLIRRGKLSYKDLMSIQQKRNSVNAILDGKIEFGRINESKINEELVKYRFDLSNEEYELISRKKKRRKKSKDKPN